MSESNRSKILEAAIALFGERGFAGVSISELQAEAEVTRSTLFEWFESKENLFERALEEALKRLLQPGDFALTVLENRKKEPLPALLRTAMEQWYSVTPPEVARFVIHACLSGNKKWREMALAPIERTMELLAAGMEREMKKTHSGFNARAAAQGIVLALLQFKVLMGGSRQTRQEMSEVRAVIEQWLAGLAAVI